MTGDGFARLDIVPVWARFNDELVRLVDYVPDDKMNWSPKPELWNFGQVLGHIAEGRDIWLGRNVRDGVSAPRVEMWTKDVAKDAYRRDLGALVPFLSDAARLDAVYETRREPRTGHWIAYHLLEHDIHHRADVLHYLALLGIATPDVGTP